jgi:hypothetical protein
LTDLAQFGDAIGLEEYGYTNPYDISYVRQFHDHGDGTRVLHHQNASYEICGDCATSTLTKRGSNDEVIYRIHLKGHTHSTGVFALKRQLVCVTILETESSYSMSNSKTVLGKEIPIWETRSAIEVYSWESGELLSTIVMPGGTFHGVLAISADERYLYVGGNLFLRRFEIPNLPEAKDGD